MVIITVFEHEHGCIIEFENIEQVESMTESYTESFFNSRKNKKKHTK